MAVTKPDPTKFDSDDDSISEARPELEILVNSFNTIADDYNDGSLGAGGLGTYGIPTTTLFPASGSYTTSTSVSPTESQNHVVIRGRGNITLGIDIKAIADFAATGAGGFGIIYLEFLNSEAYYGAGTSTITTQVKWGSDVVISDTVTESEESIYYVLHIRFVDEELDFGTTGRFRNIHKVYEEKGPFTTK